MKEADTPTNRQTNWTIIARELKKFGIIADPVAKEKLVRGNQELINEILPLMVKYDLRAGKIIELVMLDTLKNIETDDQTNDGGYQSRARTPTQILAISKSQASSIG